MKFFRVPKLGAFIAIRLSYQSCLSVEALDAAVENLREIEEKKAVQEEEKREWFEEQEAEKEAQLKEGNEDWAMPEKEWERFDPEPY